MAIASLTEFSTPTSAKIYTHPLKGASYPEEVGQGQVHQVSNSGVGQRTLTNWSTGVSSPGFLQGDLYCTSYANNPRWHAHTHTQTHTHTYVYANTLEGLVLQQINTEDQIAHTLYAPFSIHTIAKVQSIALSLQHGTTRKSVDKVTGALANSNKHSLGVTNL